MGSDRTAWNKPDVTEKGSYHLEMGAYLWVTTKNKSTCRNVDGCEGKLEKKGNQHNISSANENNITVKKQKIWNENKSKQKWMNKKRKTCKFYDWNCFADDTF